MGCCLSLGNAALLYDACEKGKVDVARLLLEKGAEVDRATKKGSTPLGIARKKGHSAVVALLEEHLESKFALHAAARTGDVEAMTQLLDGGAEVDAKKDGATTLFVACEGGHIDAARLLVDRGAAVDRTSIWRKMEDVTSLMVATFGSHIDVIRLLLERGANLELATEHGATALLVACACGRVDAARVLLERGADVKRAETSGPGRGMDALALAKHHKQGAVVALLENHLHPLHAAANTGDVDAMTQLLDGGAAIDQTRGDGETPLWTASFEGHANVSRLLLDRGASVDHGDDYGQTPLWVACLKGRADIASLLLERGADTSRVTKKGTTSLGIAQKKGHSAVVALLEAHRN